MGRVLREWLRVGDHCRAGNSSVSLGVFWKEEEDGWEHTILTVPSHELDTKVSFVVWFQKTEKVSLLCS